MPLYVDVKPVASDYEKAARKEHGAPYDGIAEFVGLLSHGGPTWVLIRCPGEGLMVRMVHPTRVTFMAGES